MKKIECMSYLLSKRNDCEQECRKLCFAAIQNTRASDDELRKFQHLIFYLKEKFFLSNEQTKKYKEILYKILEINKCHNQELFSKKWEKLCDFAENHAIAR